MLFRIRNSFPNWNSWQILYQKQFFENLFWELGDFWEHISDVFICFFVHCPENQGNKETSLALLLTPFLNPPSIIVFFFSSILLELSSKIKFYFWKQPFLWSVLKTGSPSPPSPLFLVDLNLLECPTIPPQSFTTRVRPQGQSIGWFLKVKFIVMLAKTWGNFVELRNKHIIFYPQIPLSRNSHVLTLKRLNVG